MEGSHLHSRYLHVQGCEPALPAPKLAAGLTETRPTTTEVGSIQQRLRGQC